MTEEQKLALFTLRSHIQGEATRVRNELTSAINSLRVDLAREENRLMQGDGYTPNSVGIIQSRGPVIDKLCGELNQLTKATQAVVAATNRMLELEGR